MLWLDNASVDLVLTSPPYDDLRKYHGYSFEFEYVAKDIVRVLKSGGVCVWIVADATHAGSESGTSFRQALFFKKLGLRLHDTMIWNKTWAFDGAKTRYANVFEYMFILSKGAPKTFNPIADRPNKSAGRDATGTRRLVSGKTVANAKGKIIKATGKRFNIWDIFPVMSQKERCGHPAPFPISLARDHIHSWTNEGDLVLDPFAGSGTTIVAAKELNRRGIGFEISPEYVAICNKRLKI